MTKKINDDTKSIKEEINELDIKIINSNQKKYLLEQLQYELNLINKSFEKITDLMSGAMQSGSTNSFFDEMQIVNRHNHKISDLDIEGEICDIQKLISRLSEERDKLEDKIKNEE